jgi:hypothetical protein
MGGLVHFPRTGARQSDAEWHDPADNPLRSTRKTSDATLVSWIDVTPLRDGDDEGDGGGTAA